MFASDSEETDYDSASEGAASDAFEDDGKLGDLLDRDDLEDIESGTTVQLGIETKYQPIWEGDEAFREFYQNWKDAIIKSFTLDPKKFKPEYQQVPNKKQILIIVRHPELVQADGTQQLLGFIRFTWKGSDGRGVLEFMNKNARLQLRHLGMGGTTKRGDGNQAGYHGEGMTLGALVMRRWPQNYSVRYESHGYSWTFNFNKKRKLYCRVSRMRTKSMLWGKSEFQIDRMEDVYLKLGAVRKARMSYGSVQKTNQILLSDFQCWLNMTIDIQPPWRVFRAKDGSGLILDEGYKGKNYLKGLFLYKELHVGDAVVAYDFGSGTPDRDRERFISSDAKKLPDWRTDIWQKAIIKDDPFVSKEELLTKYVQLLKKEGEKGGRHLGKGSGEKDAELGPDSAEEIAQKVWKHLLSQSDQGSKPYFYYCESENAEEKGVITEFLNQTPDPLPKHLWSILRSHEPQCRTPKEEQKHRFNKSDVVVTPDTTYAHHMIRALQASLDLSPLSSATNVEYVRDQDLGIDATYSNKFLKVSDRWLCFDSVHETTECERSRMEKAKSWPAEASGVFFCDHAVIELYALALDQFPQPEDIQHREYTDLKKSMRAVACEALSRLPRNVRAQPTSQPGEIKVTWDSAESALVAQYSDKEYVIILHDEDTCSNRRLDVLHSQDGPSCNCRREKAPLGVRSLSLRGFDPSRKYFPMIARDEEKSFYGLAPLAVSPSRSQMGETGSQSILLVDQEPSLSACSSGSFHGYHAPYAESEYSALSDNSSPQAFGPPVEESDDDDFLELHDHPCRTRPRPTSSDNIPSMHTEKQTIENQIPIGDVVRRPGFPYTYSWFSTPGRRGAVIGLPSNMTPPQLPGQYGSSKDKHAASRKRPRTED